MKENRLKLKAYGTSDIGLVRSNNEDAWYSAVHSSIFLIADGLGGHQSGEIASKEAIDIFLSTYREYQTQEESGVENLQLLQKIFQHVNREIYRLSSSHELLRGMGTTLIAFQIKDHKAFISHVGDSRLYRLQKNHSTIEQITQDHLIRLTKDNPGHYKGYLTKAMGTQPHVEPDLLSLDVQTGDLFLMCTDGLSDMVQDEEIGKTLLLSLTLEQKVRMLVSIAKRYGGIDNITLLLIEVGENEIIP